MWFSQRRVRRVSSERKVEEREERKQTSVKKNRTNTSSRSIENPHLWIPIFHPLQQLFHWFVLPLIETVICKVYSSFLKEWQYYSITVLPVAILPTDPQLNLPSLASYHCSACHAFHSWKTHMQFTVTIKVVLSIFFFFFLKWWVE